MFSQAVIQLIVILALSWTALGALALIVLVIRDLVRKKLW